MYTLAIFIARGIDHSTGGIGARDERWGGLHPSNIHREGYIPLSTRGIGAHNEYWKGVHPSNIHWEGYMPLDRGYRGTQ